MPSICAAPTRGAIGSGGPQLRSRSSQRSRLNAPLTTTGPAPLPCAFRATPAARGRVVAYDGRGDLQKKLDGAYQTANSAVDTITDLVPETVPRGTAKLGVTTVGVLLVFTILQKILSTFITLGLLAAAGYFFLNMSSGGGSSGSDDIDAGDSSELDEARKIMDKYK